MFFEKSLGEDESARERGGKYVFRRGKNRSRLCCIIGADASKSRRRRAEASGWSTRVACSTGWRAPTPAKILMRLPCLPAQGNRIKKNGVILRRSDARRAQVAGIAQPKNPVECRNDVRSCLMILRGLTGSFDSVPPRLRPRSTALRMTAFFDAIALSAGPQTIDHPHKTP
jgi:hypothetical protein